MKKYLFILVVLLCISTVFATPLNEGFEGTTFPPEGWTVYNLGDTNTWFRSTSNSPHTGIAHAQITYHSSIAHNDWLVTPQLLPSAENHTISFWAKNYSSSFVERFNVKLSTGTIAVEDFTVDLELNVGPPATYTQYSYDLSAYIDTPVYIALQAISTNQFYLFVDDFEGPDIYIPALPPNPAIVVSPANNATIVAIDAQLNWASGGGYPTGYHLYFGDSNPPTYIGDMRDATTYDPGTLAYERPYYWRVVSYNEYGTLEENDCPIWSFTTREDPTKPLPYTQNFESGTSLSAIEWTGDMSIGSNHGTDGSNGLYRNLYSYTTSTNAATPPIGPLAENNQIVFDYRYKAYSASNDPLNLSENDKLEVQVFFEDGSRIVAHTIDRSNHIPSTEFANVVVPVNGYAGEIVNVKFLATWGAGDYYVDIDNVVVRETPANPIFSYTPTAIDFGSVPHGVPSAPQNVRIGNTGGGTLHKSDISFALVDDDRDEFDFNIDGLPETLAAGEYALFPVYAIANTVGPINTTLRMTYDGNDYDVSLSAIGLEPGLVMIGNGTATGTYLPVNTLYNYSYSQTIYLQNEINIPDQRIEKIAYYWNGDGTGVNNDQWTIYMGHTDATGFASTTDWKAYSNLTQVFSGTVNFPTSAGWMEITLTTPFVYYNSDNLVIATLEESPGYNNSGAFWNTVAAGRSLRCHSDSVIPDPASPPTGTAQGNYPNIKMFFGDLPTEPVFAINPEEYDFKKVQIDTEVQKTFTIRNNGAGTLLIAKEDISISGTDEDEFDLVEIEHDISLGTGADEEITVIFAPKTKGLKEAVLSIIDNTGSGKALHEINLSGEGIDSRITEFPWTEDFDAENAIPAGWTVVNVDGGGTNWEVKTNSPHSSPNCVEHTYASGDQEGWLITPPIMVPEASEGKLAFAWWTYCLYPGDIESNTLAINTTNDPNDDNWVEIWNYSSPVASWREESISLEAYSGHTVYIAFVYIGNFANSWRIDDLNIDFVYDYPDGIDTVYLDDEGNPVATITVDGGSANNHELLPGDWPTVNNGLYIPELQIALELFGAGPWTITIQTTAPWGAYHRNGNWTAVENTSGTELVFNIAAAKGGGLVIPITLGGSDPTLPVALSSFNAVLTADLHVKIAWVAESETNHAGYNLYRSEVDQLSTALKLNAGLILDGDNSGGQISYEYLDIEVDKDANYYYWLESLSLNGEADYYGPLYVSIKAGAEDQEIPVIPLETKLYSAFPNPFNPATNLRYSMKEAGEAVIQVYNLKGQLVHSFHQSHAAPGYYQVSWNGRDQAGNPVASGVYFYRMTSGKYTATKKMIMSK